VKSSKSQERTRRKGQVQHGNESQFRMQDMAVNASASKREPTYERRSDHLYYREGAMNYISQQARENSSFHKMQQALQQAGTSHLISMGHDDQYGMFDSRDGSLQKSRSQSAFLETVPQSRLTSTRLSRLESGRKPLGKDARGPDAADEYDRYIQNRNNAPDSLFVSPTQRAPLHQTNVTSARGKSAGGRDMRGEQMESSLGRRCDSSMTRKLNFLKS